MREFNTLGPVNPALHYHVDRVSVKAELRQRIDKGRYLTLNAARQIGKTTLFQEMSDELAATGEYFTIVLDFEQLAEFKGRRFYTRLAVALERWQQSFPISVPKPSPMRDHGDLIDWLQATVRTVGKRGVLIIDEFDAVSVTIIKPILSLLRGMYIERRDPRRKTDALHSILLVGVRNLPALLEGTQSPFNIADQFTIPYFRPDEVEALLAQHTSETGQRFAPDVVESILQETEGQPFLVNRLGQILTKEVVPTPAETITTTHLHKALSNLITENNNHFYSMISKATPHRSLLLPILLYNQIRTDFLDPVTQELIMYGVLRVIADEQHFHYARIGNPIYRKMLLLRFTKPLTALPINGGLTNQYLVEGFLNFDGLLDRFKAFMTEHGVRLMKSEKTNRPLEISGQYLLLSYLTAALNSLGGYVTIESVSSAGEIDIMAFYRENRFIIETKVWYNIAKYEAGKQQLVRYLQAASLDKGYMMIFDEHLETNPVLEEQSEVFEITVEGKTLRIYLVGVTV